jgi:cytochrome P450 family 49 subfamily A
MKPKSALQYLEPMQVVASEFIDRIRLIRDDKLEMPDDFQNEFYKWALECESRHP